MTISARIKPVVPRILVSLMAALSVTGFIAVVTRTPEGNSTGFPLTWSSPISPCSTPNPFNGCGFSYSIPIIVLDDAIWVAIIFSLLALSGRLRNRTSKVVIS